jgi:hypothetical protein
MYDDDVPFALDQHAQLDASSLKQQSANRHVIPLGHIIMSPSQPVSLLNAAFLAEKQQISIL